MYKIDGYEVEQIKLPLSDDMGIYPRLQWDGWGVHAGDVFRTWLPDSWHDITLEVRDSPTGPGCWYISNPGLSDVCPIGLWCQV